jgi:hypothetical protein
MGLGDTFLQLVKRLVIGAKAKIIVNQLYTNNISIKRGLRQGDPLAPLLFAISRQPLISYVDYQIESQKLLATSISKELIVYHKLFADDVGIFIHALEIAFEELRKCITLYEKASGAKLNLQKYIIKYLRTPFGNNLSSAAIVVGITIAL